MYSKYMIIVKDYDCIKPFVTVLEFDDAEEAFETYEEYSREYNVVLYRRFKHDYIDL